MKIRIAKKTYLKNVLLLVIIPIFLFFIWVLGILFANPSGGFTILIYPYNNSVFTHLPKDNLLVVGKSVAGEFKAQDNNLGIITMQVNEKPVVNTDNQLSVLFRIKEDSANNWYYERTSSVGSIKEDNSLIFGFPKIINSKNKIYIFEVVAISGSKDNQFTIVSSYDSLVARYIYSKNQVVKDKLYLSLAYRKVLSTLTYPKALFATSTFVLPLVFYILFMILFEWSHTALFRKYFKKFYEAEGTTKTNSFIQYCVKKSMLGSVTVLFICVDIFLIQSIYYGIALGLIGFWIVAVIKDKIPMKVSLALSLVWLLLSELDIAFYNYAQEDKTAMWTYFFLCIAVVQIIFSEIKRFRKL